MSKRLMIIRAFTALLLCPLLGMGQPSNLISSARTVDTGKVKETPGINTASEPVGESAPLQNPMVAPLFGERAKTSAHIEWEIKFLNDCDQNFGSRQEASQFFATRAWDYLAEGQLDTAANRFNLAWLLNEKNVDPYWGLGVVSYQRGQLPEAMQLLKKGLAVSDTNAVMITDLATVQIQYFQEKQDSTMLDEAAEWLDKSLRLNPNYANTHLRLSWIHFVRGQYAEAWERFHKARNLDLSTLDLNYLNQLLAKLPDPQGIFK